MKTLPRGAKVDAINQAIKTGQKFYVNTYDGKLEVTGLASDGHFARAKGRSWAICSTHIDTWYAEIGKVDPNMKIELGEKAPKIKGDFTESEAAHACAEPTMKIETTLQIKTYQAKLEESVKASVKLNVAKKALQALPHSYAIKEALVEIINKQCHHDRVVKNSMHNIAVLELKEGI